METTEEKSTTFSFLLIYQKPILQTTSRLFLFQQLGWIIMKLKFVMSSTIGLETKQKTGNYYIHIILKKRYQECLSLACPTHSMSTAFICAVITLHHLQSMVQCIQAEWQQTKSSQINITYAGGGIWTHESRRTIAN